MSKDVLTPGMLAILQTLADGGEVDGRSWRSLEAAQRRDLVVYIDGRPQLTPAGRKAIAGQPGLSLEQWLELRHDPSWKPRRPRA